MAKDYVNSDILAMAKDFEAQADAIDDEEDYKRGGMVRVRLYKAAVHLREAFIEVSQVTPTGFLLRSPMYVGGVAAITRCAKCNAVLWTGDDVYSGGEDGLHPQEFRHVRCP